MIRDSALGFVAGLLFGIGLSLSGMTDPAVVLGFLDISGAWNPQLLFVMVGGVSITFFGYRLVFRSARPLCASGFALPQSKRISPSLIYGSALFGVGWGLAGYCPGPAVASLASARLEVVLFVAAMLLGMATVRRLVS